MWCNNSVFTHLMMELSCELGAICIAPSLRYHDATKPSPYLGKTSIEDYVSDISAFIFTLQKKVILCGHSMGGLVAALVARHLGPGFVSRYIGITCAAPAWVTLGSAAFLRMPKYLTKFVFGQQFVLRHDDAQELLFNTFPGSEARRSAHRLIPESGRVAMELVMWKYSLNKLYCPSLVIGASEDKLTPNQKPIAKKLGSDFVEIQGASHMVIIERAAEVASIMTNWLESKVASTVALAA